MLVLICFALIFSLSYSTPLDDYVNTDDGYFNYSLIKTYEMTDYKLYIINMTSQKWYDETVVSQSIWWHYVGIIHFCLVFHVY
jgi:PhoPQ-activated pathogenicity-related protein